VIGAMTVRELREVRGPQGVNELGWEEFSIVGAAASGNWTIALAPMASHAKHSTTALRSQV